MTPERIEEIHRDAKDGYGPLDASISNTELLELMAALEEAQQQLHRTQITSSVNEGNSDSYFSECERLRGLLAEAQQTIAAIQKRIDEQIGWTGEDGKELAGDIERIIVGETQP